MENMIDWKDAFKDEEFRSELRNFIEDILEENTATDEEIDEMLNNIFGYDKETESIKINTRAAKNVIDKSTLKTSGDDRQIEDDDALSRPSYLRLKLLLLLMNDNGLKLDKNNKSNDVVKTSGHPYRGNGVRAAKIMSIITGLSIRTCQNFISNPTIITDAQNEINIINKLLESVGIKIRL